MDRDTEIAEIKRELDILRTHHALYAKWARVLKAFFTIATPLTTIALAAAAITWNGADPLIAGFITMIVIAVCAIIYLVFTPSNHSRGWIDLASPAVRFGYPPKDLRSLLITARPSDALVIEEQIAARERRLIELGVAP